MSARRPKTTCLLAEVPGLRKDLIAPLEEMGISSWAELRQHDWRDLFRQLVEARPRLCTRAVARSLCAAERGQTVGQLAESRLDDAHAFFSVISERRRTDSGVPPGPAADQQRRADRKYWRRLAGRRS